MQYLQTLHMIAHECSGKSAWRPKNGLSMWYKSMFYLSQPHGRGKMMTCVVDDPRFRPPLACPAFTEAIQPKYFALLLQLSWSLRLPAPAQKPNRRGLYRRSLCSTDYSFSYCRTQAIKGISQSKMNGQMASAVPMNPSCQCLPGARQLLSKLQLLKRWDSNVQIFRLCCQHLSGR